jgi:hypothetical protein
MANASGGTIIYGIREKDKVAHSLDDGFDLVTFSRESLEQIIDSNIQPRIEGLRIEVVPLSTKPGRVAYVVSIPQAVDRAPHQASDKRYYKRANFVNQMMEDYEVRDALRRARRPDLYLAWSLENVRIKDEKELCTFDLRADIENRSREPALYTSCFIYLDVNLHFFSGSSWPRAGRITLPDDSEANRYVQQLMLPNSFPIIREQPQSLTLRGLKFVPEHFRRFAIGYGLRAPGCQRDDYATIVYQSG